MKRIIVGIFVLILAIGIAFYASASNFHNISLSPYDSKEINLNSPIDLISIKNVSASISLSVINGSIDKIINESNQEIIIVSLNASRGELILINNSSSLLNIKYNIETLNSTRVLLFFGSIIIFISGSVLVLTEIKRKK
ncbi:hypothetical protein [Acidianus manzaensis]|uniref:Uncharacterized protein n=1 Tax=Acidianus manzaensis TaxID=282676 RepID=A0A1W6JX77_9CREN|nr:hypothetical protein [Acidianus manzaensis]ARM74842.1 hypothetical protein B6F84_01575 [Acidianus manzaensis]